MDTPPPHLEPEAAMQRLTEELDRGIRLVARAATPRDLEDAETAVLGRKSPLNLIQRALKTWGEDDRRAVGIRTNEVRTALQMAVAERRAGLETEREASMLEAEWIDVTLPGRRPRPGSLHPLTLTANRIVEVFTRMGYRVVEGPEIE